MSIICFIVGLFWAFDPGFRWAPEGDLQTACIWFIIAWIIHGTGGKSS